MFSNDLRLKQFNERVDEAVRQILVKHKAIQPHIPPVYRLYGAYHNHWGLWTPSIRGSVEAAKRTFKDWDEHEKSCWRIIPLTVMDNYPH
jgi:hypothetical protein